MSTPPEDTQSSGAPMASAKADLRQLNVNSKATVEELQEFLRQLKGKSPQEMLGIVAASQLFRAIILSTIIVAVGVLVFTVVPFLLGGKDAPAVTENPAPTPSPAAPANPKPAPAEPTPAPGPGEEPAPDADPISKLGVGEEKKAPPNKNPLENNNDDFLKGLD